MWHLGSKSSARSTISRRHQSAYRRSLTATTTTVPIRTLTGVRASLSPELSESYPRSGTVVRLRLRVAFCYFFVGFVGGNRGAMATGVASPVACLGVNDVGSIGADLADSSRMRLWVGFEELVDQGLQSDSEE